MRKRIAIWPAAAAAATTAAFVLRAPAEDQIWLTKAGLTAGADIVSDGTNLYRVGGDGDPDGLYRYDGPDWDTWTKLADNPQTYSHRSPGEGNRAWCFRGRITVAADADEATCLAAAKAEANVVRALDGKTIVKEIVVPGRLVNLVAK